MRPAGSRLGPLPLLELGLLLAAAALCWILVPLAAGAWLDRVSGLRLAGGPDPDAVRSSARLACLLFSAGIAALAAGRAIGLRRAPDALAAPLLLPAAAGAALTGLVLHAATVETGFHTAGAVRAQFAVAPTTAGFAQGFFLGSLAAGIVLALAVDPGALARRAQPALVVAIAAVLAALALVGTGPGESGTRINLGPVQPLEAVKLAVVTFLAADLGARAAKLRWQRGRLFLVRWPRPVLLFPALAALVASFAGMYLVGDLGPSLILGLVFLAMFYLATRAAGWVVAGLAAIALVLVLVSIWPQLAGGGHLATRLAMWHDPWSNGLGHGHQVGEGLWAISAGGLSGQGLAQAHTPVPPAGLTDLALALLVEETGFAGLLLYVGLIAAVVLSALHIAARNRTPERVLLAAGIALLVLVQWGIIQAGTFGLLPLTGVIVPFLSTGRSSMVVFLLAVACVARLAEGGRERAASTELDELRRGVLPLAVLAAAVFAAALVTAAIPAVLNKEEVASRGIVVRLRDGTVLERQNPRLLAIAAALRRGALEDRDGRPIAHNPDPAQPSVRAYPLGTAMGTLLGRHPSRVKLPAWALEARWDERLRGYPERPDAPRYADFVAGAGRGRLPSPDLRRLAPILYLSGSARLARLRELDAAVAARSVRLSIDARLQTEVVHALARRASAPAAAAAVIEVATGQVLARAQAPDLDPADEGWQEQLAGGDAELARRFWGVYGPGADKTGAVGVFQAGSVAKLATAVAAARTGWPVGGGGGCELRGGPVFACSERDAEGPRFALEGWPRPIHDFSQDRMHGEIDPVRALAVSCNVYFGQLGLELGPEPFRALVADGVEIGYGNRTIPFDPGPAGSRQLASTAFGQGAMAMNVLQAARLAAAIGAGGVYRKCPASLELAAPCQERRIVDDPAALTPILAGMRRVMTEGTGARLETVPGARIYGKTGTADTPPFRGEELYGSAAGTPPPHSWFVALVEPESAPECAPSAPGRIAIAVVVPRGGIGSQRAGPIAIEIVKSLVRLGYLPAGAGARR